MPAETIPLPSATIGPQSWHDDAVRSIRRAERLVRKVGVADSSSKRPRSCSASAGRCSRRGDPGRKAEGNFVKEDDGANKNETNDTIIPLSAAAMRPRSALLPFYSAVSPPFLRERCLDAGTGVAVGYMRCVRSVELLLRQQAGKVWLECVKLERERGHLEGMLKTLRKNLMVNRRSVEDRTLRPALTETGRDGADGLLDYEKRELTELKSQLEGTLRNTLEQLQALKQCSKMLLECSNERSRVLHLLPRTGSRSAQGCCSPDRIQLKTSPVGPYTPECEQAVASSCMALSQSRSLRDQIRQMICEATARQKAAHQSVNEGLVKKIKETVTLKQHLTVSSAATRHAINGKHRQLDGVEHSHGRALGPVSCRDLQSRERLDRPVVQLYRRHSGNQLSEALHIVQGTAKLRQDLSSLGGELGHLNGAHIQLMENLQGKEAAAHVDAAVVRLRRRQTECH
ncbi:coiled-coil domain-containing protein 105 [Brienomyrus brachyistius]|uniref:coiled-coil domain-containing protein 105 n=1 Tax=Brienomyrus brachyistius TaxID=42636 RepID=UPI0020B3C538|nr:coiled-coil domain-containing protein 105 [Brienomyrus brachyistius]